MRNLRILLWALIAIPVVIGGVLFPDVPRLWFVLSFAVLGTIIEAVSAHLRRRQTIAEYSMEETGVIGLGLGGSRQKKEQDK